MVFIKKPPPANTLVAKNNAAFYNYGKKNASTNFVLFQKHDDGTTIEYKNFTNELLRRYGFRFEIKSFGN